MTKAAFLVILMLFALSGDKNGTPSNDTFSEMPELVQACDYFEVYSTTPGEYKYYIYNLDGELVYENNASIPVIYMVDDDLIWIEHGVGTATTQVRFFSLSKNELSDWYDTPRGAGYGLVAYMTYEDGAEHTPVLQIKDIFDEEPTWTFKRDFSPVANLGGILSDVEFISSTQVQATYLLGENYTETIEIIYLK